MAANYPLPQQKFPVLTVVGRPLPRTGSARGTGPGPTPSPSTWGSSGWSLSCCQKPCATHLLRCSRLPLDSHRQSISPRAPCIVAGRFRSGSTAADCLRCRVSPVANAELPLHFLLVTAHSLLAKTEHLGDLLSLLLRPARRRKHGSTDEALALARQYTPEQMRIVQELLAAA
jgi:hypothetical protein